MRPGRDALTRRTAEFQSSPGLEAGCDYAPEGRDVQDWLFQSSPGLEAGCDEPRQVVVRGPVVSILTRLGSRMRLATVPWSRLATTVSILTRLGSRMRLYGNGAGTGRDMFQSSPGLEAGCDPTRLSRRWP